MKHVVVLEDHPEAGLRPGDVYREIAQAISREAPALLPGPERAPIPCPACSRALTREGKPSFMKLSFSFLECPDCRSAWVSPRPTRKALAAYRERSTSARLWRERFYSPSDERLAKIFAPRAAWIIETTLQRELKGAVVDIKSRYPSLLRELQRSGAFSERWALEPDASLAPRLADCGFQALPEARALDAAAALALEVLEESCDPAADLDAARRLLAPGGLLFLTTRSASGFEFSMLKELSEGLLPPHHLNLFSVDGLLGLLERSGFETLELSTPGQLDVELVRRAAQGDPGLKLPPFIDDVLRTSDEGVRQAFQDFLQRAGRSTHLRLAARKR